MPALGGSGILPPLGLAPAAVAAQSLVAVGVARGVCVPPSGAGSVRLACSLVCGGALWLLSLCCLPGLWWSLAALPWLLWPRLGGGRWSVRRCRVALGVGAFGRRRGRFPARWSWSGSGRPRRRRCSRRPGRAGVGSRWRFAGLPVRSSVSPCRWPCRRLSGWPLPVLCPPCRSGRGPRRSPGLPALARRRCRRAPVADRPLRRLSPALARQVLVTAPVLLLAIQIAAGLPLSAA